LASKELARSGTAADELVATLEANRRGERLGVFSVCSANRHVLQASMQIARDRQCLLLIESTSNQVNQFGGYTGQTPRDFVQFVRNLAAEERLPFDRILLGGDHLGPHVWRKEPSAAAMQKACELVRDSVLAGYTKIHLDASMHCADDPGDRHRPLADEVVSTRAAAMCAAAEAAWQQLPAGTAKPFYVIGTEVPIPGGELGEGAAPAVTKPADLQRTIEIAGDVFASEGLQDAWQRVIAIVVQPGVEFGDNSVFAYNAGRAAQLAYFVPAGWHGVYEAHSTDYQTAAALEDLVRDHFAILKVGPWLTFAFREAVFALQAMENEIIAGRSGVTPSHIAEELERAMLANPQYWKEYYRGDEQALRLARKYSYSDRCRYYWTEPAVAQALDRLCANLAAHPAPASLLSQFLPRQAEQVREGALANAPHALIHSKIHEVLSVYAGACGSHAAGDIHAQ